MGIHQKNAGAGSFGIRTKGEKNQKRKKEWGRKKRRGEGEKKHKEEC